MIKIKCSFFEQEWVKQIKHSIDNTRDVTKTFFHKTETKTSVSKTETKTKTSVGKTETKTSVGKIQIETKTFASFLFSVII